MSRTTPEMRQRYVERHPDAVKESRRAYAEAHPDRVRESYRKYRETHRAQIAESSRLRAKAQRASGLRQRLQQNQPLERRVAWRRLQTALDGGRIVRQPCMVCGAEKTHAHHHLGYAGHELDVVWLCPLHHRQAHSS